ncbi:Piso0_000527 [Millerozyma farinosa CBS 7064]|uniref:Piso0_000527 protein n=1 Tax=Pichia sorbitophila (strain ATCC MYA-4447 / BCRC 22081 / CBS 7064 / NBRC 10061 / NRRL Y-12695) TaxID=559304 RepID=G8YU82_PICSO|nr:Piso0_000527 [Millerozyma farinosa CBS 7064]CCE73483.1 Piso0_000527 [Millerozyma farinosa CBS 7064]
MRLLGRRAIITGSSRGLGKALAVKLAQEGCSVTAVARNQDLLKNTVEQLPTLGNLQKHKYLSLDLMSLVENPRPRELQSALEECNILINCAGQTTHSLLPRLDDQAIVSTINLNLTAPILLTKMFYKSVIKQRSKRETDSFKPSVLNISSILACSSHTYPGTSVYASSKAGVARFTQCLAEELQGRLRVNVILPGLITETDMGSKALIPSPPTPMELILQTAMDIILDESMNSSCIVIDETRKYNYK